MPAWLGSFRKRSQSTKAPCGQRGFGTSLGGHGTRFAMYFRRATEQHPVPLPRRSPQGWVLDPLGAHFVVTDDRFHLRLPTLSHFAGLAKRRLNGGLT